MRHEPLVTVALPVRNGADTLEMVAKSVLAQDHQAVELLICDNASTDHTRDLAEWLAEADDRVRYHRHPANIGLLANFEWAKREARGEFVRWIGDTDELMPNYVSRCLEVFATDPRLVLVTTQLEYVTNEGDHRSARYDARPLTSGDPLVRLQEFLRLLNRSYADLDPLYGLARTDAVRPLTLDPMLRGDEVYAVKLALAGPWGHVPETLGRRRWTDPSAGELATLLGVPRWQVPVRGSIETRAMLRLVDDFGFGPADRRAARRAVLRLQLDRHVHATRRRARRLAAEVGRR